MKVFDKSTQKLHVKEDIQVGLYEVVYILHLSHECNNDCITWLEVNGTSLPGG